MKLFPEKIRTLIGRNPWVSFFIIWILACGIGTYFRLYPLMHHTSDEASEKATVMMVAKLQEYVRAMIDNEFPQLHPNAKKQLVKEQVNKLLRSQNKEAREAISGLARQFDKKFSSENDFPYLLASDSYYYYDLTQRIQETGTVSDTKKGSKYLNKLMLAPLGHWEPFNLHPFFGFLIHKIISFFNPKTQLMYSISFTPLVITILSVIPFLFICSFLKCGWWASLVGSFYLVLAPIFLKRSAFGWYDNDPYNILFPLIILALLLHSLKKRQNIKTTIIFALLCALSISVYALFWHGWMFFETIIIISAIIILLYNNFVIKEKTESKNLLIYFSVVVVTTLIGISIIFGATEFFVLFKEGWAALKDFIEPQVSLWPNLYIGVGELHATPFHEIIDMTGGYVFFIIALLGLVLYLVKSLRHPKENNPFAIFIITIFLFAAIFVTRGALRFTLLCLTPLSILVALGIQNIFDFIAKIISKKLPQKLYPRIITHIILIVISAGLLVMPAVNAHKRISTSLLNPIFNDHWKNILEKIESQTPPDSIINTWWPPGHFVKAIAKRRVTFDGATINFPQAYWLANVFLAQNEVEALGMLRMLNNSGNKAVEYLLSLEFKLSDAVDLLKQITPLNKQQAREKLSRRLSGNQINELLNLTHKKPPPSYIMLYDELVDKNIQLAFVGKWDFKEIERISNDPKLRKELLASGTEKYVDLVWKLAGGQPKYSGVFPALAQSNTELLFAHNVKINLEKMHCNVDSKKFGKGVPYSLIYFQDNDMLEKKFYDANLPYSAMLFKESDDYKCLLLDTDLAKSLIMRLYFFAGKGLKYISPILEESNLTKRTQIYVYRIDWEGFMNR